MHALVLHSRIARYYAPSYAPSYAHPCCILAEAIGVLTHPLASLPTHQVHVQEEETRGVDFHSFDYLFSMKAVEAMKAHTKRTRNTVRRARRASFRASGRRKRDDSDLANPKGFPQSLPKSMSRRRIKEINA
jgi:hypothetical protein